MYQRRGQAAMEFLITYGWAILAAIVAIGVLAYFLSSPGRLTANSCIVATPFNCNAGLAILPPTNSIQLELRNGGGEDFNITSVTITGCATVSPYVLAPADQLTMITVTPCAPALAAGTFRGDITVTYRKLSGSTLDQQSTGRFVQRL